MNATSKLLTALWAAVEDFYLTHEIEILYALTPAAFLAAFAATFLTCSKIFGKPEPHRAAENAAYYTCCYCFPCAHSCNAEVYFRLGKDAFGGVCPCGDGGKFVEFELPKTLENARVGSDGGDFPEKLTGFKKIVKHTQNKNPTSTERAKQK